MTASDFLQLLWENTPENLYILIWMLHGKQSNWFRSPTDAADFVKTHDTDVYVGVGLSKDDLGRDHRCLSENIAGLPGFGVDFDIRSAAHPKDLPNSIEDALTLLPASLPPTIIVATGNGLQAWWLFKEPWIFDSEDERKQAATLSSRLQTLFRYTSSQRGWAFERLSDLARVLRIPGTVNGKDASQPKNVSLHSFEGCRYNPSELEEFLDDLAIPDSEAERSASRDWKERFSDKCIVVNLGARIPSDTIDRWCSADERFRNTWFRQRTDLHDASQSGYDMALACFGIAEHLDEQQIVDLIIHHRFHHHQKQRTRAEYFQRTISKAASGRSQSSTTQVGIAATSPGDAREKGIRPPSPSSTSDTKSPDPSIAKAQTWGRVSEVLGIEIYRVVKITGKDPIYRMDVAGGKIEFPTVKKLVTQELFRCIIAAAVNHYPPKQKSKAWEAIAQMMLSALTEEDGGEEMDLEGRARMYVSQYLAEIGFIDSVERENIQNARKPWILDGSVTVCSSDLQIYVNKITGQNLAIQTVAAMLSVVGAVSFRLHRKLVDQTRWKLPSAEFDPAQYSEQYREGLDDAD